MTFFHPKSGEPFMTYLVVHPNPLIRWVENYRVKKLLKLVGSGGRVLELGCETGHITKKLAVGFRDVMAVEYDVHTCELAMKELKNLGNVNLIFGDATKIQVSDNHFDVVLASCVLEHIGDGEGAVVEWLRVLKPGGRLVVNVPNDKLTVFVKRLFPQRFLGALQKGLYEEHLVLFDEKELTCLLKRIGCEFRVHWSFNPLSFFNVFVTITKTEGEKENDN